MLNLPLRKLLIIWKFATNFPCHQLIIFFLSKKLADFREWQNQPFENGTTHEFFWLQSFEWFLKTLETIWDLHLGRQSSIWTDISTKENTRHRCPCDKTLTAQRKTGWFSCKHTVVRESSFQFCEVLANVASIFFVCLINTGRAGGPDPENRLQKERWTRVSCETNLSFLFLQERVSLAWNSLQFGRTDALHLPTENQPAASYSFIWYLRDSHTGPLQSEGSGGLFPNWKWKQDNVELLRGPSSSIAATKVIYLRKCGNKDAFAENIYKRK